MCEGKTFTNDSFCEEEYLVDFIGMGDYIQKYNEHLEQIMTGLYTDLGTQGMLRIKR